MADEDDEFGYNDADLDALPANALREIETQAILSTQQRKPVVQWQQPSVRPTVALQAPPPDSPSAEYDFGDEVVINLDEEAADAPDDSSMTLRETTTAGRDRQTYPKTAATRPNVSRQNTRQPSSGKRKAYKDDESHNSESGKIPGAQSRGKDIDISELRKRIQELENERIALLKSNQEYQALALSKAGEVAIVRANLDKATKEFDRRISVLQKLHADVETKQKAELEAVRRDKEKTETDNRFLEHEFAHETGRAKAARRALKDGTSNTVRGAASAAVTPKKNRVAQFGDGFDDEDVVMPSPTKSRSRSKPSTPKQSSKRKRTGGEPSPSKPLPLSDKAESVQLNESMVVEVQDTDSHSAFLESVAKDDEKFKFLQRLMRHRPLSQRETTFEAFTKHAYPSSPSRLLSSTIYDSLAHYRGDADDFPLHLCRVLLSLWDQCLQEKYFSPVRLIIDTLQFVLTFSPLESAATLTEILLPLVLSTADPVSLPPGQALMDPTTLKSFDTSPQTELRKHIDLLECLSLLLTVARSCAAHGLDATTRFWQHMNHNFVLLMLVKTQPLPVLHITLLLLRTSATPTSFGPLGSTSTPAATAQQAARETVLLDRLTTLLYQAPEPQAGQPRYSPVRIAQLRLALLQTLTALQPHIHGTQLLSNHRTFTARLVLFLDTSISALYTVMPDAPLHATLTTTINLAARLLHHVLSRLRGAGTERRARLAALPGAGHAHLVALTRLAFAEEKGVLEGGLEDEVVDMAHALLDEFLSPEEGEALLAVFGSGRSV